MVAAGAGDRAYNTASSADSQQLFNTAAAELEALLDLRDKQVRAAMAQYMATGVSEEYHAKEVRWNTKAQEIRDTIRKLRMSLQKNDDTALTALKQAGNAVANII